MRLKTIAMAAVTVALTVFAPMAAMAAPVTWYLSGVTFSDGGTASGSFVFDAATSTYSSVNIVTSGGTVASSTYVAVVPSPQSDDSLIQGLTSAGNGAGSPTIALFYANFLTDAGGTVGFFNPVSGEGQCGGPSCATFSGGTPLRTVVSGQVTTVRPIPTMSEWAMILLGVALAGGAVLMIQRRRVIA